MFWNCPGWLTKHFIHSEMFFNQQISSLKCPNGGVKVNCGPLAPKVKLLLRFSTSMHWLYSWMHNQCCYWTLGISWILMCLMNDICWVFPRYHLYSLWQPLYIAVCLPLCVCLKVVVMLVESVLLLCLSLHVSGVIYFFEVHLSRWLKSLYSIFRWCAHKYSKEQVYPCLCVSQEKYFQWIKLTIHSCWHIGRIITNLKRSKAHLDSDL